MARSQWSLTKPKIDCTHKRRCWHGALLAIDDCAGRTQKKTDKKEIFTKPQKTSVTQG
jgi:hypothetical protein